MSGADRFAGFAAGYDDLAETTGADRYAAIVAAVPPGAARVLDAGCGSGALALRLARTAGQIVGLDVSPAMLAVAERRRRAARAHNLHLVLGDVGRPPLRAATFDVVVTCNVLHDTATEPAVVALRRLVKAGGRLVIVDLVASWPRLHASRAFQTLLTLWVAPRLAVRHGPLAAARLVAFRVWRTWRQPRTGRLVLTPEAARTLHARLLPGCRFTQRRRGSLTTLWDASSTPSPSPPPPPARTS
jgi:ubiquinone/menaquinone biosynthesis C-methylase UbiE